MNYSIKTNTHLRNFRGVEYGEIFLDKDNMPYIKTPDFCVDIGAYIYNNSICLATGEGKGFNESDMVLIPTEHELKIYF